MSQGFSSADPVLVTIVLATLAIGLPIVFVLAIRFLWERSVTLGRSKELEKLIWQLHRIASAMEHQMNLSYPAVQPGTEEPRDIAYLRQIAVQQGSAPLANAAQVAAAQMAAAVAPAAAASAPPVAGANPTLAPAASTAAQEPVRPAPLEIPTGEVPRAGVNSMFGL